MIHDISDAHEQFHALDVRGQIVRNRMEVLSELITSLREDFAAGRFCAVVIHFRIFLHHVVNAYLVSTIPDSRILAGQDTPSGTDAMKVQQALDDTFDPTPETKLLLDGLSKAIHAIQPPPEESKGMAEHLMNAANKWFQLIVEEDIRLNKWWDHLRAKGVITGRFEVGAKKKKRITATVSSA